MHRKGVIGAGLNIGTLAYLKSGGVAGKEWSQLRSPLFRTLKLETAVAFV